MRGDRIRRNDQGKGMKIVFGIKDVEEGTKNKEMKMVREEIFYFRKKTVNPIGYGRCAYSGCISGEVSEKSCVPFPLLLRPG